MSISRITRERLYQDEAIFNKLLPFARYDEEQGMFVHTDASLWSIWELQPLWITKTSDSDAMNMSSSLQEMLDALEHDLSVQFNWITTFDIEQILKSTLDKYPSGGIPGWMAKRWVRMLKHASTSQIFQRRPRKMRLIVSFRYDPPWRTRGLMQQLRRTFSMLFTGDVTVSTDQRRREYQNYANNFKGVIEGNVQKLRDLGFAPQKVDGQGLINLLYPLLNRRSVKPGKFRRGRNTKVPVPVYDPHEFLSNQISETMVEHPKNGIIKKDGRYYRTVSMVSQPKQCLPIMLAPLQSSPYENIISVTFSKDPRDQQLRRLDNLDSTLGLRERAPGGRGNQKVQHQIAAIRTARQELYSNASQIVRAGVHQTFICQTEEEVVRAASEAVATFPQVHGARGMVHQISDLA
ncbi:MAG: TraC family protein, partial [Bdellovibrionales bacterium]|nr:TraC family protein [Bdellovibrionales bacterium]